jgi:serine/threonine-protein kinase
MTQAGIVLGTAAYMSPEQARGKPVDRRADIWAFGCLLYEMLTGQPAFGGEDVTITLARILERDTDLGSLPAAISPAVRHTIGLCLEKDVAKRVRDIGDVKLALQGVFEAPRRDRSGAIPSVPLWRRMLPATLALIVGGLLVGAVSWSLRSTPAPRLVTRFAFDLPVGQSLRLTQSRVLALSRDGRSIVYNTDQGFYLRRLDALEARLIPGSEAPGAGPVFSPDGQWIGFGVGDNVYQRLSINGGAPVVLANMNGGLNAASWEMLISGADGIYRLPATGGAPELVIPAGDGVQLTAPRMVPDGDTVLFTAASQGNWDAAEIVAQSISTGQRKVLVSRGIDAHYVATGHLVYALQNSLFAAPFDVATLTVSGAAVPVVQGVMRTSPAVRANFDVSDDGTLVYMTGNVAAEARTLVWVDRAGQVEPIAMPPRAYMSPRLSPDGTKVALSARDQEIDIWIWDLSRATLTRFSFDPGQDRFPAWAPDGQRIAYSTPSHTEGSLWDLVGQAADGTGVPERLAGGPGQIFPTAFLPDASGIVAYGSAAGDDNIALVELDEQGTITPLLRTPYSETMPELSPNGRWLAYVSDESGNEEVYVRPFPNVEAGRWQVSTSGGTQPLWSRNGEELFYRNGNSLNAVPVETDSSFSAGNARRLFEGQYYAGPQGGRNYDVSPDGQRFLMIGNSEDASAQPTIVVVENWAEELKRLVPTE